MSLLKFSLLSASAKRQRSIEITLSLGDEAFYIFVFNCDVGVKDIEQGFSVVCLQP